MGRNNHIVVDTKPSTFGIHWWLGWLHCQRQRYLADIENHTKPRGLGDGALAVGSITHGILKWHYSHEPALGMAADTKKFVYETDTGEPIENIEAVMEAERLYRAYRATYPSDEKRHDLGEVLAVEQAIDLSDLARAAGLDIQLTARPDMIIHADKKSGLEKGVYIPDHKTAGQDEGGMIDRAMTDFQFTLYGLYGMSAYPKNFKGILVNMLIKTATPKFRRFVIPPMAIKANEGALWTTLHLANEARKQAAEQVEQKKQPNPRPIACNSTLSTGMTRVFTTQCGFWPSCSRRIA